jgi:hypothetical protein
MSSQPASTAPRIDTCRRRDLRLQVLGQLYGHVVALDVPLAVENVSGGGFAVVSPIPFQAGTSHQFRFTTAQDRTVTVTAHAIHCMRCVAPTGEPRFLIGFEFARGTDDATMEDAIDSLLDSALSVISFQ